MAYTPYYAPYYRPMNYYNPSIPNGDNQNMQGGQPFSQPNGQPIQQQIPMQSPIQQMPIVPSAPTNDMLFVLNETEATAFPVAPNNSGTLWDKNQDTVYIKSVNMQGVPSMRILDYTERTADNAPKTPTEHKCTCGDKFATKEQINDLEGKIKDLAAKYEELSRPIVEKPKTTAKKTKESEE